MHVPPPEQQGSSFDDVEPIVDAAPEPIIELQLKAGDDPVFDISRPAPAEDEGETPSLSFDAFKDIKPVAFGGAAAEEGDGAPAVEPEPETAEPESEPEPPVERVVEVEQDPLDAVEPVVEIEAEPVVEIATEPIAYVEPDPIAYVEPDPMPVVEPEPFVEPEPAFEPEAAIEPEPVAQVEAPAETKKKGRFSIPNPELRLPSFSRKAKAAKPAKEPKAKRGSKLPNPQLKLPALSLRKKQDKPVAAAPAETSSEKRKSFVTLPENLQGPLSEVERKIVLCGVAAVFAAGAFGFATAPSEEPVTPAPSSAVPAR